MLHDWMYPNADSSAGMGMGGFTSTKGMSTKSGNMMASGPPPDMGSISGGSGSAAVVAAGPVVADFINVAHSLWTLLLAFCGGQFCKWLYATRPQPTPGRAPPQA